MNLPMRHPIAVPLLCGLCLGVQIITHPNLRLPLPLGAEDLFIIDWLKQYLPLQANAVQIGELWRTFTYVFLHGSWWHLALNLFGLWITGNTLEALLGWRKTFLLLLTGATAGAAGFFLSILLDPRLSPYTTCIGASALLTACIGAVVTLAPREHITLWITALPLRLKAVWLLPLMLLFFITECLLPQLSTAYGAHLGGWIAGLLCGFLLREPHHNS